MEGFISQEWIAYLCALIAPFVQEDAAVLGAASAAISGLGKPWAMFLAISMGLTASDLWKYWLGRAAITQAWARKYAERPNIMKTKDKIVGNLGQSLLVARFIPGARIPLYIASGFFRAPFPKFAFFIVLSALIYISLAFGLFFALGEVAGESAKKYLPIVAIILFIGIFITKKIRSGRSAEP